MNAADATVPAAVLAAAPAIARAVDDISERLRAGGRLVYVGAGSSGRHRGSRRLGVRGHVLHPARTVVALVAGGELAAALVQAAAEDDRDAGAADLLALAPAPADAVVGISASGRRRTSWSARQRAARGRRPHRLRRLCRGFAARRRSSTTRSPSWSARSSSRARPV